MKKPRMLVAILSFLFAFSAFVHAKAFDVQTSNANLQSSSISQIKGDSGSAYISISAKDGSSLVH